MRVPISETRSKNTLHLSLPEELVKQVREVAWRKRRHTRRTSAATSLRPAFKSWLRRTRLPPTRWRR